MHVNQQGGKTRRMFRARERRWGSLPAAVLLGAALAWCGGALLAAEKPAAEEARRVLIVTGEDYPGHKWKATTPVLQQQLERDQRLRVDVLQDLTKLAAAPLADYDVVVLHFKNYDPQTPGRQGLDNLQQYVEHGGGLVLVHFACGAFQEFDRDFEKLVGRVWNPKLRGHDPRGKFRVDIAAADHPVTRKMQAFETDDELYTCLAGDTPITVLATAVSKVDKKTYPLAFVLSPGKGRVFHCVLGHDVQALEGDGVGELFRRGAAWAARLDAEKE
jgi:type 1 glutamine amidotransferase